MHYGPLKNGNLSDQDISDKMLNLHFEELEASL